MWVCVLEIVHFINILDNQTNHHTFVRNDSSFTLQNFVTTSHYITSHPSTTHHTHNLALPLIYIILLILWYYKFWGLPFAILWLHLLTTIILCDGILIPELRGLANFQMMKEGGEGVMFGSGWSTWSVR